VAEKLGRPAFSQFLKIFQIFLQNLGPNYVQIARYLIEEENKK
jgi:hypothetical protein